MLHDAALLYPTVSHENLYCLTRRYSPAVSLHGNGHTVGKRRFVIVPDTVFVGNLAMEMKEQQLEDIFSRFGKVKRVEIAVGLDGVSKGFGFVIFYDKMPVRKVEQAEVLAEERLLSTAQAVQMVSVPGQQVSDGPIVHAQQHTPVIAPPLYTASSDLLQYRPHIIPYYPDPHSPQYFYPRLHLYHHVHSPPYPQQQYLPTLQKY